jgi:hypothetical protein
MAIEMTHPLELNTHVKISVRSASSNVQPLEVSGKIVRVTEEGEECFLIGINIAEID